MADLPEGTVLRAGPGWPALRLDLDEPQPSRVYIMPGVPALLRSKVERLEALPGELPQGEGWHLATLLSTLEEAQMAALLEQVLERFPGIEIGSYPRWTRNRDGGVSYHVRITFEGPAAQAEQVQEAPSRARTGPPARYAGRRAHRRVAGLGPGRAAFGRKPRPGPRRPARARGGILRRAC